MAQPQVYKPDVNFSELHSGQWDKLNDEFAAIARSLEAIINNLALIQEDDGRLKPGIVDGDQLADRTAAGVRPAKDWEPVVEYSLNDTVYVQNSVFRCVKRHLSENFDADRRNGKWREILDLNPMIAAGRAVIDDPKLKTVADKASAIDKVSSIVQKIEAVSRIAASVELVAGQIGSVMKVRAALSDIVKIEAALPVLEKLAASMDALVAVANDLDAVLEAPVHAARAEQAAARAARQGKFNVSNGEK